MKWQSSSGNTYMYVYKFTCFLIFEGVESYIDHGISPQKLIIGIPWHGYDYTCVNFTKNVRNIFHKMKAISRSIFLKD
jgi:hypothetical protein